MLEANTNNSKAIPKLSLIELTWVEGFQTSSLNFMHIIMVDCTTSESN